MAHDHDDTPPDHDVVGYLVRLSAELGELRVYAERHQQHIACLRSDVVDFRDEVRAMAPRLDDHTGRLKKLEAMGRAASGRMQRWQGIAIGVGLGLGLSGGLIAALAGMGLFE